MPFDFEPDLSRASTPPPSIYSDPRFLEREHRAVFARTWQLVGRTSLLEGHGDFACAELAGHPIVLVRDGDAIRGYHNVCAHRGGRVASGCGRRASLSCQYHGWTYALSGQLKAAPEMQEVEGFDLADVQLARVEVGVRGPLVFAAIAPAMSLDEQLASIDIPGNLGWVMRRDYLVEANWKIYVDNYLEGYHIPIVHPELHKELDYAEYRTELDRYWSRQHAPLRPLAGEAAERRYRPEQGDDAAYYWVFPNLMLNIYQGQLQTNVVEPMGVDRTRVIFEWYAEEPPADPSADARWRELVDMSDLVQAQDAEICATVHRNMRSPGARRGRYSVRRESGVHHFHGLLHELLRSDPKA